MAQTIAPITYAPIAESASLSVHQMEIEDQLVEHRLVRRVMVATAILIPVGAGFFALLMFVAAHVASVPAGPLVAMGAGIGVLAGSFFGMWAGVVASVSEVERQAETGPIRTSAAES